MSDCCGYPTLIDLCAHMNAADSASRKHVSHSHTPSIQCLSSSSVAEASTVMAGAGSVDSKPSGFIAATPGAVTSLPHFHFPPAKREPHVSPLVLGSEERQSCGNEQFDLDTKEGIAVSSASSSLMSRRATLPFSAVPTCHGVGDATTSEGAPRLSPPILVGSCKSIYEPAPRRSVTHSGVTLALEMMSHDPQQQSHLNGLVSLGSAVSGEDDVDDAFAAGQGRPSLSGNCLSSVRAFRGKGRAVQSIDVECTPYSSISEADALLGAVETSEEEGYLLNLGATRRPGTCSSVDREATVAADVCVLGNDIDSSPWSCDCLWMRGSPDPHCVSHMPDTTTSSKAEPLEVLERASASTAPAELTHRRFSSSRPGGGILPTTIRTTASATLPTAHAGDDLHLPKSLPGAREGTAPFPHNDREDTWMGGEGVLDVSGDPTAKTCIQGKPPLAAHDTGTVQHDGSGGDKRSAPIPGVSGVGVRTCTGHDGRLSYTIPVDHAQSNTLLLTDTITEVCTSSFATATTGKSTQESSSLTQLLGSREGGSIAARGSASRLRHERNSFGAGITGPKLGTPLQETEALRGQKQKVQPPSISPTDVFHIGAQSSSEVSGGAPATEVTNSSSSPSPFSRSSPMARWSPLLARAQRRATVAALAQMEQVPDEGAVLKRGEIPDERKTIISTATRPPPLLLKEPDPAEEVCGDLFDAVPEAQATDKSCSAPAHSVFPGDDAVVGNSAGTFFRSLLQSKLGKWMTWAAHKYHGVVHGTSGVAGEEQSAPQHPLDSPPRSSLSPQRKPNDGSTGHSISFLPVDGAEALDNGNSAFYDLRPFKSETSHLSFALSLSTSQLNSSCDGDRSRHSGVQEALCGRTPLWSGGGSNSWYSVGLQTVARGTGRATKGSMQLHHSITESPLLPSTCDAPFLTSPGEQRCGSTPLPNLSFSGESLTSTFDALSSRIFSGGVVQRFSRNLGSTRNRSASDTSTWVHHHKCVRGSNTSAIPDDHYRDTLYQLFRHPPSSLIGDLTECYKAYKSMATSLNGNHVLNWGELSLLLQPEDYVDYRALFPHYHFVTFDNFVEFVEVLSVRYHR
ncbi:hypothetical protein, unknown function [Leishmania tarentolae]|uniref:Uncharacterized protein n=1 Tax=Leishmania tarentolae TaxID=5689 RepID=A0A640L122_LEITA|nr:hypothetical protein, unknown function [Leishmania tarentolae]